MVVGRIVPESGGVENAAEARGWLRGARSPPVGGGRVARYRLRRRRGGFVGHRSGSGDDSQGSPGDCPRRGADGPHPTPRGPAGRASDKAIPYGVYDMARNEAWVSVGWDHDRPAFAVASIRHWWGQMGCDAYSEATTLFITADAGGSNGYTGPAPGSTSFNSCGKTCSEFDLGR